MTGGSDGPHTWRPKEKARWVCPAFGRDEVVTIRERPFGTLARVIRPDGRRCTVPLEQLQPIPPR